MKASLFLRLVAAARGLASPVDMSAPQSGYESGLEVRQTASGCLFQ